MNHLFATGHNKIVKLWDSRKFEVNCEVCSVATTGSTLREIYFDPQFGKFLMTQDKDIVRLFRASDLSKLDEFT